MAYYYSPFRKQYIKKGKITGACPFCNEEDMRKQVIRRADGTPVENEHYSWIINLLPKFEGHTMIIPKKHVTEIGAESKKAVAAREEITSVAAETLRALYPNAGIEIFLQTGEASLASIAHLHWHIVPSLPSDLIRGFEKLGHFYTTEKDKEQVVLFPIEIKLAKGKLQRALSKALIKQPKGKR